MLKDPERTGLSRRVLVILIAWGLIVVLVLSMLLPLVMGIRSGLDKRVDEKDVPQANDLEMYMKEAGAQLKDGVEVDAEGNIKTRAEDFPEESVPGSEFLESMQPKFEFSLTGWFMELEDASLQFSRTNMDHFIVNMMNLYYGQLNEVYTLEELKDMPEVLDLEDYLWERLGVTEYVEGARSRFQETVAELTKESEERESRIQRNKDLLFDNVLSLRTDFANSKHRELFDVLVTLTGLNEEEMTELVGIIVEVTMYHRSESAKSDEGILSGSELREAVVGTTVEGLWNSQSHMAFLAIDTEYQPLLSLLVELVVGQLENLDTLEE